MDLYNVPIATGDTITLTFMNNGPSTVLTSPTATGGPYPTIVFTFVGSTPTPIPPTPTTDAWKAYNVSSTAATGTIAANATTPILWPPTQSITTPTVIAYNKDPDPTRPTTSAPASIGNNGQGGDRSKIVNTNPGSYDIATSVTVAPSITTGTLIMNIVVTPPTPQGGSSSTSTTHSSTAFTTPATTPIPAQQKLMYTFHNVSLQANSTVAVTITNTANTATYTYSQPSVSFSLGTPGS